jgi:hypothetical protein
MWRGILKIFWFFVELNKAWARELKSKHENEITFDEKVPRDVYEE